MSITLDLYYKEKEQMKEYLTKRNMAIDDTPELTTHRRLCSSTRIINGFVRTSSHRMMEMGVRATPHRLLSN